MNYTSVKTLYIICGYPKMISRFGNLYQLEFSGQGEAEEIIPINNLLQKLIHYGHKIIKSFKCFPRRVIYVPTSHLLVKISHQSCSCFIYFSFRSMLRPKTKTKKHIQLQFSPMKVAGFVFSLLSIIFPTSVVAASSNCFEISKFHLLFSSWQSSQALSRCAFLHLIP